MLIGLWTPCSASAFARRHLALLGRTMDHSGLDCTNKPPGNIYVPMPKSVPVAAPSLAPAAAPPAPALVATPPPASVLKPLAPISPRFSHEIKHEVAGRMRGETRAMRDASRKYAHRH
ncbi:unnamed protein product, partial [Ascophyllum nodosum]